MEAVKRIDVLGCPFDAISFDDAVACVRRAVIENRRLHIVTGNIDFVMKAKRDPIFAEEIRRADLVTADGVPILWAASLLGAPLRGRVNGTDLVWKCAEISAETGCAVALIGAAPGVAPRAAKKMQERFPEATIHAVPTPFELGRREIAEMVEQIRATNAKIILAALGAPRQERWLQAHLDECGANVGIGCGSAFDIICGDMPRAPRWMRENGLEWFHRMLLEPKRLGRRYLIEDSPFILHFIAAFARRLPKRVTNNMAMQSSQKTSKASFRDEREFGLTVGIMLILLGGWWFYAGRWKLVATGFLALGPALVMLGSLFPRALVLANRAWMALAKLLFLFTTPIILAIVFFGILMPTGAIKRLFGWDPLRRRASPGASYWSSYNARQRDPRHFEKMY